MGTRDAIYTIAQPHCTRTGDSNRARMLAAEALDLNPHFHIDT